MPRVSGVVATLLATRADVDASPAATRRTSPPTRDTPSAARSASNLPPEAVVMTAVTSQLHPLPLLASEAEQKKEEVKR